MRTKSIVASSKIHCNMDGCKTGSRQHRIPSQPVASSPRDVGNQSARRGTQAEAKCPAAVGVTAVSAAVASLARGTAQGVWWRSSMNDPSGSWEDTKALSKAGTGNPRDRNAISPKLDTPNRAWTGFRHFCCLLQLICSHKESFLLCEPCWVQLCLTGTQPRQCKETPRTMKLYIAFFESSSPERQRWVTALLP